MNAIDAHTHAFPDSLAGRAIAALEDQCTWKAVAGGTVADLLASMDAAGVDVSVLCTIATKPGQAAGILSWCEQIRSERIVPLPSVHPDAPDAAKWITTFAEAGFAGIKLHPMYQDFYADEPRMDAIYAAAQQHGVFVTLHCGRDIGFPQDDDRASPQRIAGLKRRFGDLKLICTHMGGWQMWDQAEQHLIGSDVMLETSFSLDKLSPARAAEMIRRHGCRRVMLGSDWPWSRQDNAIEYVRKLPLSTEETDAILHHSAARLLGL
ncbi:MAG: amidohydrolase family protein [Planctomycetota bacterium]|nr:amidohydrolase family protein [Planctomycetota bacterium]